MNAQRTPRSKDDDMPRRQAPSNPEKLSYIRTLCKAIGADAASNAGEFLLDETVWLAPVHGAKEAWEFGVGGYDSRVGGAPTFKLAAAKAVSHCAQLMIKRASDSLG